MRRFLTFSRRSGECERVRALMSDYVDGELDEERARRVDEHVGMCPRCRQVLANLRYTLERIGRLADRPPSGGESEAAIVERIRAAWRDRA